MIRRSDWWIFLIAATIVAMIVYVSDMNKPKPKESGWMKCSSFINTDKMFYRHLRATYDIPAYFPDEDIDSVLAISGRYKIPEHIAFNMIHEESRFDSTADNGLCGGYMQLNKKYFKWGNRFDNMLQGLRFLRSKYDEYETWAGAVIYYNSGGNMSSRPAYVNYILYNQKPKR